MSCAEVDSSRTVRRSVSTLTLKSGTIRYVARAIGDTPTCECLIFIGGGIQDNEDEAGPLLDAACHDLGWRVFLPLNDLGAKRPMCATTGSRKWIGTLAKPGLLVEFATEAARMCAQQSVHLSGLSNGGIIAWDLVLAQPKLFKSLTVFPGCPTETHVGKLRRLLGNMRACPIHSVVGSRDCAFAQPARNIAAILSDLKHPSAVLEVLEGWGHTLNPSYQTTMSDSRGIEGALFPFSTEHFVSVLTSHCMITRAELTNMPNASLQFGSSASHAENGAHADPFQLIHGDCEVATGDIPLGCCSPVAAHSAVSPGMVAGGSSEAKGSPPSGSSAHGALHIAKATAPRDPKHAATGTLARTPPRSASRGANPQRLRPRSVPHGATPQRSPRLRNTPPGSPRLSRAALAGPEEARKKREGYERDADGNGEGQKGRKCDGLEKGMRTQKSDWDKRAQAGMAAAAEARRKRILAQQLSHQDEKLLEISPQDWLKQTSPLRNLHQTTLALPALPGWPQVAVCDRGITDVACDALVNAANRTLLGGNGIDGVVHQMAGPLLLRECARAGACPVGEARLTKGYNVPCPLIIHAVGPNVRAGDPKHLLKACYESILEIVSHNSIRSVALPCISTGIFGYDRKEAAHVALVCVRDWLISGAPPVPFERVLFCCFDQLDTYSELVERVFPPAGLASCKPE